MKNLLILLPLIFISNVSLAAINTSYPGCNIYGSTPTDVDTKPKYYYPIQDPLNKNALEANQAISDQK